MSKKVDLTTPPFETNDTELTRIADAIDATVKERNQLTATEAQSLLLLYNDDAIDTMQQHDIVAIWRNITAKISMFHPIDIVLDDGSTITLPPMYREITPLNSLSDKEIMDKFNGREDRANAHNTEYEKAVIMLKAALVAAQSDAEMKESYSQFMELSDKIMGGKAAEQTGDTEGGGVDSSDWF